MSVSDEDWDDEAETETEGDSGSGESVDSRGLPPIHRILIPESMKIMSTRIRWLKAVGYEVREISNFLGIRYQQVRNVVTTQPKRAAREDMAPLEIRVKPLIDDNLELMDQRALEEEMRMQRVEHRAARRALNKTRRAEGYEDEE